MTLPEKLPVLLMVNIQGKLCVGVCVCGGGLGWGMGWRIQGKLCWGVWGWRIQGKLWWGVCVGGVKDSG